MTRLLLFTPISLTNSTPKYVLPLAVHARAFQMLPPCQSSLGAEGHLENLRHPLEEQKAMLNLNTPLTGSRSEHRNESAENVKMRAKKLVNGLFMLFLLA